jgi:hypothetical protein
VPVQPPWTSMHMHSLLLIEVSELPVSILRVTSFADTESKAKKHGKISLCLHHACQTPGAFLTAIKIRVECCERKRGWLYSCQWRPQVTLRMDWNFKCKPLSFKAMKPSTILMSLQMQQQYLPRSHKVVLCRPSRLCQTHGHGTFCSAC